MSAEQQVADHAGKHAWGRRGKTEDIKDTMAEAQQHVMTNTGLWLGTEWFRPGGVCQQIARAPGSTHMGVACMWTWSNTSC